MGLAPIKLELKRDSLLVMDITIESQAALSEASMVSISELRDPSLFY